MPNGFMYPGGGGGGAAQEIILRAKGDAGVEVEATLDGKTYKGTIGEQGFVDIRLKELGEYSVKASKDGYSYTQTVKVYQYGITECMTAVKKSFSECTPEEIMSTVKAGLASTYWERGDIHKIMLKSQEEIEVVIADFSHDVRADGNAIPLTLIMKNCFETTYAMNLTNTTVGGWEKCNFRTDVLPGILDKFPDEWQKIMTPCQKKSNAGNRSTSIVTTEDTLWLPSEIEMFGSVLYSAPGEGSLYPIFPDDNSRIKTVRGTASYYFLRSQVTSYATDFASIRNTGTQSRLEAGTPYGIAVGFCVG